MNLLKKLGLAMTLLTVLAMSALAPAQEADETAARDRALKLYQVFRGREWKSLLHLIQLSPAVAKATPDDPDQFAKDFVTGLKRGDPDNAFGKLMDSMTDVKVGAAIIEGNNAYVSTSSVVMLNGNKVNFLGMIRMVKSDGVWKWDVSFSDDVEKATEQRFRQLLGEPSPID